MLKSKRRYHFLLKITIIVLFSFLIAAALMWIFFRSTARNIGYYLSAGRKETAALLISEYLGNPPSKLKAKILSHMYGISFKYYKNGVLKWTIGERIDVGKGLGYGSRSGLYNRMFERMHRMMRGIFKKDIYLGNGDMITIFFPIYPHRKFFLFPVILIFFVIIVISLLIFFLIKKALLPIQKLIDASHRIGNGDLTYRLEYKRNDEFADVVNAFNVMAGKLENMLRSQRELLHMISHELRTPLTRINLALELDDFKKSKKIIKEETTEINELIESIMDLSRLDSEHIGAEKCDLVTVLNRVLKKYNKNDYKANIMVESAWVKGKQFLLEKAIGNIVDNAIKYSDMSKPVYIELYEQKDNYVCKVMNSGKGLTEEEIENIFKPFFRGSNAIENSKDGKGLGLVVAKRIIEEIDGVISCKSTPNGPTEFILTIPHN